MRKYPISDQKNLKNSLENPSVPGDLSFFCDFTAFRTSEYVK